MANITKGMDYKLKCEIFVNFTPEDGKLIAEEKALFVCDPELNTECSYTGCGECTMTSNVNFAKKFNVFE